MGTFILIIIWLILLPFIFQGIMIVIWIVIVVIALMLTILGAIWDWITRLFK